LIPGIVNEDRKRSVKLSSVGMSLHLLLVANWMIFLVYEDNDFRHTSIHFFEAIKPFSVPLTGLEET